jgi:glycosyltransferase involved in cell wall biosynthesis
LADQIGRYAGVEGWTGKEPVSGNGFVLTGFVNNAELGEKYRAARCFILGSHREKWGVVVHEAAASGCMLLLSSAVGSHFDFARTENAALFAPDSIEQFEAGMEKIVGMDGVQLETAQRTSVELAAQFSPGVYARNLKDAITQLRKENK